MAQSDLPGLKNWYRSNRGPAGSVTFEDARWWLEVSRFSSIWTGEPNVVSISYISGSVELGCGVEVLGVVVYMTVYSGDGSQSKIDAKKASISAVSTKEAMRYLGKYVPCSPSFFAQPGPDGRAGNSKVMTRGFFSSAIAKAPAVH